MSEWLEHGFKEKLIAIFQSDYFDVKEPHHFGRPFVSAYQLAVAFEKVHPEVCRELNKSMGTPSDGKDSLPRYLANRLSQDIAQAKRDGDVYPIEGVWLSGEGLGDLHFISTEGTQIAAKANQDHSGFSLFRLRPSYSSERKIYEAAYKFVREEMLEAGGFDPDCIEQYLTPRYKIGELDLKGLYRMLLFHGANTAFGGGDIQNVYRRSWEKAPKRQQELWRNLKKNFLFDFDPIQTAQAYPTADVFITAYLQANPDIELKYYSERYSSTIVDAAHFLRDREEEGGFYAWMDKYYPHDLAYPADELARQIKGIGTALSRDFLKEIGYTDYIKPDEHILDICEGLELITGRDTGQAIAALFRIAKQCDDVTPYRLDKLFFLIGSGAFYGEGHEAIQKMFDLDGRSLEKRKQALIAYIKEYINQ